MTDIEIYLPALIMVRTRPLGDKRTFRLPQVEPLLELPPGRSLWCPVPGMYGGINLRWADGAVISESWSHVVGGSERRQGLTRILGGFSHETDGKTAVMPTPPAREIPSHRTRAVSPFVPLPEPRPLPVGRTSDVWAVLAADLVLYGLVISRLGGRSG